MEPKGDISQPAGVFCGIALYPILSRSVHPETISIATAASRMRYSLSAIMKYGYLLLGKSLDERIEEVVFVHFKNVESNSCGEEKTGCCQDYHDDFRFHTLYCAPDVTWLQGSSKPCNLI